MVDAKGNLDASQRAQSKDLLIAYKDTIAHLTREAREFIEDAACQVREKVADLKDIDFAEVSEKARKSVGRNPGKALLISAGVGLAIGIILRAIRH